MMVFFKERLVYLAVPKTGTTALQAALYNRAAVIFRDPPGLKHTNARGFDRKYRSLFERSDLRPLETCAVMRDPVDWLGSWYRYRQRPALNGHPNSTREVSFDHFVEAYLQEEQPPFAKLGSQGRFLTNGTRAKAVDYLFRYENMGSFIEFLEDRLGSKITTERMNVSPKTNFALSPEVLQRLRTGLELDYRLYDSIQD